MRVVNVTFTDERILFFEAFNFRVIGMKILWKYVILKQLYTSTSVLWIKIRVLKMKSWFELPNLLTLEFHYFRIEIRFIYAQNLQLEKKKFFYFRIYTFYYFRIRILFNYYSEIVVLEIRMFDSIAWTFPNVLFSGSSIGVNLSHSEWTSVKV